MFLGLWGTLYKALWRRLARLLHVYKYLSAESVERKVRSTDGQTAVYYPCRYFREMECEWRRGVCNHCLRVMLSGELLLTRHWIFWCSFQVRKSLSAKKHSLRGSKDSTLKWFITSCIIQGVAAGTWQCRQHVKTPRVSWNTCVTLRLWTVGGGALCYCPMFGIAYRFLQNTQLFCSSINERITYSTLLLLLLSSSLFSSLYNVSTSSCAHLTIILSSSSSSLSHSSLLPLIPFLLWAL